MGVEDKTLTNAGNPNRPSQEGISEIQVTIPSELIEHVGDEVLAEVDTTVPEVVLTQKDGSEIIQDKKKKIQLVAKHFRIRSPKSPKSPKGLPKPK